MWQSGIGTGCQNVLCQSPEGRLWFPKCRCLLGGSSGFYGCWEQPKLACLSQANRWLSHKLFSALFLSFLGSREL